MRELPVFDSADCERELLQLKDHLANGEKSYWSVRAQPTDPYKPDLFSGQFSNYAEAKAKFDTLPADTHRHLTLVTRIGTEARFHYKPPEEAK